MDDTIVNVPGTISVIDPIFWKSVKSPFASESCIVKAFLCPHVPVAVKVTETGSPPQNFAAETELIEIDCPRPSAGKRRSASPLRRMNRVMMIFIGQNG